MKRTQLWKYRPAFYQHYKGGLYMRIVAAAKHTETNELCEVYIQLKTLRPFHRPSSMWHEPVYWKGKWRPRFRRLNLWEVIKICLNQH